MKLCPKCQAALKPKALGAVEVDECPRCRGLWFDKDELRQAKDVAEDDLQWMDFEIWKHEDAFQSSASDRPCPTCEKPMAVVQYGDTPVEIDYCQSCQGTWLDRNEFAQIVASLHEELVTKPFSEYVKAALQEGLEVATGAESFASEWKDFTTVLRLMQYRLFIENPAVLAAVSGFQRTGPR